jgi:hypothetical protein
MTGLSLTDWLKFFGFTRHPFETTEAGGEDAYAAEFLAETFVKPECFDRILGESAHPKSTIVFAARGGGKSTARAMLAHFCREGIPPGDRPRPVEGGPWILPVLHNQFGRLVEATCDPISLVDAHVNEILYRGIPALTRMLAAHKERMMERARQMDPLRRLELQFFLLRFLTDVPFQEYRIAREILGKELVQGQDESRPIGYIVPSEPGAPGPPLSPGEIVVLLESRKQASPIDQFAHFADLLTDLGIAATYVLIDGLDELWLTADNPDAAAGLVAPLLANLTLMNTTPHVAFKVFAPDSLEAYFLEATQKVRRDRLAFEKIVWDEGRLLELLQRRLAACSKPTVISLDALSTVGLRGQIGYELVQRSRRVPRFLILLGDYVFRTRCAAAWPGDESTFYLSQEDLEKATARLTAEFPPAVLLPTVIDLGEDLLPEKAEKEPPEDTGEAVGLLERGLRDALPAPLARAYLVYLRDRSAYTRAWRLFDLVEGSTAFVSLVLLAWLHREMGTEAPTRLARTELRLKRMSLGGWRAVLEIVPGLCAGTGLSSPYATRAQRWVARQSEFIALVSEQRNRFAHAGPQADELCAQLVSELDPLLHSFLAGLGFITDSYLIRVQGISKQGGVFLHTATWYRGDAPVFPTIDLPLPAALESDRLWLVDKGGACLDLHPLLLTAPAPDGLTEEVWMYQAVEGGNVTYKNYGTGRNVPISRYRWALREVLGV